MTETSELFFLTEGGGTAGDQTFDKVPVTLSGAAAQAGPATDLSQSGTEVSLDALGAAPAEGVYFISDYQSDGGEGEISKVYEEHFGSALTYTDQLNSIDQSGVYGTGGDGNPNYGSDLIENFGVDAQDNILYFVDGEHFVEDKFSGADFSGGVTTTTLATLPGPAQEIALDLANHAAYFTGHSGSESLITKQSSYGPGSPSHNIYSGTYTGNYIYKVSGLTPSAEAGALTSDVTKISVQYNDGLVEGIASFNGEMVFTTQPADVGGGDLGNFGVYELNTSTDAITKVWTAAGQSNHGALSQMAQITIDPSTGEYYVSTQPGDIYAGNLDSNQAPNVLVNANTISGLSGSVAAEGLFIDPAATVSGTSVAGIDGNSGTKTGEIGTSDVVTIAVTFDTAVTVSGNPNLSLNDGGSAVYASGSGGEVLYFTHTPSTGQDANPLAVTGLSGGTTEDGAGVVADLSGATATFNSLTVDTTPPSLTLSGTSTEVVQGGGAELVLASAVISDAHGDGGLSGAIVSISGYQAGDVLGVDGATSGTASGINYSAANGTLSLTGDATDATYESVLEEVTYRDTGTDSSTGAHPTRTLDWSVTENTVGGALTGNAQSAITIDRPPVTASAGYAAAVTENNGISGGAGAAFTGDSDPDGDALSITQIVSSQGIATPGKQLEGAYGELTLNANGSYAYNANNTAAIDGAVDGSPPVDEFSVTVSDGHGGSATEAFDVTVNRPPALSGTTPSTTYTANDAPATVDSALAISDPDSANITGAEVAIGSGFLAGDMLTADTTGLASITASYDAADGVLNLTGQDTRADYQAVLDSVAFSSSQNDPTDGGGDTSRTVDFTVTDTAGVSSQPQSATLDVALCYLRGTRILTPTGHVPIEDLAIGDAVVTRFGGIQAIKWIGRQSFDPRFLRRNRAKIPVRIRAGALGAGEPARDLFVSPGHSVLLGNVLVLARMLVNGITVTQEHDPQDPAEYFQIELAAHDCVLAEGTWSETYADALGLRAQFHNAAEFYARYPQAPPPEALALCAKRPERGPLLEAALRPVVAAASAGLATGRLEACIERITAWKVEGWAFDLDHPELPVLLEVLLDMSVIGTVLACYRREEEPQAGKAAGRGAFSFALPKRVAPELWPRLSLRPAQLPLHRFSEISNDGSGRNEALKLA